MSIIIKKNPVIFDTGTRLSTFFLTFQYFFLTVLYNHFNTEFLINMKTVPFSYMQGYLFTFIL